MRTIGEVDGFTLCDSLAKLTSIRKLTSVKNWNQYGADPIPDKVFDKTRDILLRLINQPFIAPTANDSIQLEYHNDDGAYLEFEVFEDKIKMCFYRGTVYLKEVTKLDNLNWIVINFLYGNYDPAINMEV